MQINVTFRHTEPSVALRTYAEDKLSRIRKYVEEPIEVHVVLRVEKFRHSAEVSLDANGLRINGVEETDDMYSAIDMAADKIEAQIKKHKDKLRRHKPTDTLRGLGIERELPNPGELAEEGEARIIETKQFHVKPMDVDEAVMQMDASGQEFLVFTNRRNNRINVLYRRKDGNFGLIETLQ